MLFEWATLLSLHVVYAVSRCSAIRDPESDRKHAASRRKYWPTPTAVETKLYGTLEELRRTAVEAKLYGTLEELRRTAVEAKLYGTLEELRRTAAFIEDTGLLI
nr:hypothetical protein BaRGS_024006 [Batillaria attramentaria]